MKLGNWLRNKGGIGKPADSSDKVDLSKRALITRGPLAAAATISNSPVAAQKEFPESARNLVSKMGEVMNLANKILGNTERDELTDIFSIKTVPANESMDRAYLRGVPIARDGKIDIGVVQNSHGALVALKWLGKNLREVIKLGDLKNPHIVDEAYKLQHGPLAGVPEGGFTAGAKARRAIEILQRITGLSDEASLEDLRAAFRNRTNKMIGKIVDNPQLFPEPHNRFEFFRTLKQLAEYMHVEESEPGLMHRIASEEEKHMEIMRKIWDEESRTRWQTSARETQQKVGDAAVEPSASGEKKQVRFDTEITQEGSVKCDVEETERKARDGDAARVFLIKPKTHASKDTASELTRMHIQHLRQLLTSGVEKVLDNFDPAGTKTESESEYIRVSTTDKKFQDYLASFVGSRKPLLVPNILETIVPEVEKQETTDDPAVIARRRRFDRQEPYRP